MASYYQRLAILIDEGYTDRTPLAMDEGAKPIDVEVAERQICRKCRKRMRYEGWHRNGSYVAMAVCKCGEYVEF